MGYACPVCGDPQADTGHLANHLAFTAILGGEDHERWLDEHAPGWSEEGKAELAERVVEYAEEMEFPQVFEDTTAGNDSGMDYAPGNDQRHGDVLGGNPEWSQPGESSDPEVERILAEAREMTRQMREPGARGNDDQAALGEADEDRGGGAGGDEGG